MHGIALLSGTLGATASCFAKFAFAPDSTVAVGARQLLQQVTRQTGSLSTSGTTADQYTMAAEFLARGLCLLLMIGCNAFMLGSFIAGMEESGSVAGTALSSAANFLSSAFYGYLLFGEEFSKQWWMGFSMVNLGVILLSTVRAEPSPTPLS